MLEAIGYMAIGSFFALLLPILKAWAESKDTWVGLTDEEIDILHRISMDAVDQNGWGFLNHKRFAENIEAKLKEKNGD